MLLASSAPRSNATNAGRTPAFLIKERARRQAVRRRYGFFLVVSGFFVVSAAPAGAGAGALASLD